MKHLKKSILALLALSMLGFTACQDDGDGSGGKEETTNGTTITIIKTGDGTGNSGKSDKDGYQYQIKKKYVITFDANGGTGTMEQQVMREKTPMAISANTFTRAGYTFVGWAKTKTATTPDYTDGLTITATEAMTLYALWSAHASNYTVNHWFQTLSDGTAPAGYEKITTLTQTLSGTTDTTTNAQAHTGTGFTAKAIEQKNINGDGSTVIDVYYDRNSHSVTYADGTDSAVVSVPSTANCVYGQTVSVNFTDIGSRTGLTFAGWTDGTNTYTADGTSTFTMPDSDVTLTALWNATVTFNSMGGNYTPSSQTVAEGGTISAPGTNPTKTGLTFGGWYTSTDGGTTLSNTAFSFSTAISANTTLYAKWNAVVTFNSMGGSYTPDSQTVIPGGTISAPSTNPTKTGLTFAGWYTSTDGGTTLSNTAFTFSTAISTDTTLYAKWNAVVTFNSNGGSVVNAITVREGEKITAPTAPSKTNLTFDSWYKESSLTNAWNFNTDTVSVNTTLYAKWNATVTFNSMGGSYTPDSQTVVEGGTITSPTIVASTVPSKAGYVFVGWFTSSDGGNTLSDSLFSFTTPITSNTTLYAKWFMFTGSVYEGVIPVAVRTGASGDPADYTFNTLDSSSAEKYYAVYLEAGKTYTFQGADSWSSPNATIKALCGIDCNFELYSSSMSSLLYWDDGDNTYTVPSGQSGVYYLRIFAGGRTPSGGANSGKCGVHIYTSN